MPSKITVEEPLRKSTIAISISIAARLHVAAQSIKDTDYHTYIGESRVMFRDRGVMACVFDVHSRLKLS